MEASVDTTDWVAFSPVDRAMARRMERTAKVPIATEFTHVDVVRAMAEVKRLREKGIRTSFNTIIVAATARALADFPQVAAEVDYENWTKRIPASPNVGVAVASERGLVVPVLKEVVGKPFPALASELDEMVQSVRAGSAAPALFAGGHFTITNIGNLPIYGGVPLPNTPQIAILGVSASWDAAVVVEGEVRVSKLARLTIAIDHRALDGITAGLFLVAIKDLIEAPEQLEGSA